MKKGKIKILWLCNHYLSDIDIVHTGTWLDTIARELIDADGIELAILGAGNVKRFTPFNYQCVKQWIVPAKCKINRNGLPNRSLLDTISSACQSFAPDLINVWGTEAYWGLLTTRGILRAPSILTMQGVRNRLATNFHGNLTGIERLKCTGFRNIAKSMLFRNKGKRYNRKWGRFEIEIMAGHRWIMCQTPWQMSQVLSNRNGSNIFHVDLPLRKPFSESKKWIPKNSQPIIFCCASTWSRAKGLHCAIRAIAILKKKYPNIQLRIGGSRLRSDLFGDGYHRWLNSLIHQHSLSKNIYWCGKLNAAQMTNELCNAAAFVIPTFIESYCMVMAEAMRVGTPIVVSYTGGTAYLGKDEETCLFFMPGDEAMCAYQLDRLLSSEGLSSYLSQKAKALSLYRHNESDIIAKHLQIYREVIEKETRLVKQNCS